MGGDARVPEDGFKKSRSKVWREKKASSLSQSPHTMHASSKHLVFLLLLAARFCRCPETP
jgi:hypothetical protein